MTHLTLYTTLGCHLCEQLEALLTLLHDGDYRLERVEISEDEALLARYGVRIPVLVDAAGEELDRGFEPTRLAAWLAARGQLDEAAWARLREETGATPPGTARGAVMRDGRRYLG
ncbi:glutaredoxin family protein [Billgrantia gudaonensis]|uniref:Glutaredoxin-like domain n=1 Tax=Billgrantia gudaonensis TaxID=376427 RepID=A0A1G8MY48_9GAMM|nr:glutaredoxin family protein [Halomonas gudaonensis]SDI72250.1 Glutaredoxin-like domain [Halomonas gudaonensis]